MTEKNVYVELQKLSLAFFLAAKGSVERLFIADDNHSVSHSSPQPAPQFAETDSRIVMHARYFYRRWLLLREHSSAGSTQLIIDAWRSYYNDCLTGYHGLPLLDLVQGWQLIDACLSHAQRCRFAEDAVLPSVDAICDCPGFICQTKAVIPDE